MRRQDSYSLCEAKTFCLLNEIVRSRVESVLSTEHLDSKIKNKNWYFETFGDLEKKIRLQYSFVKKLRLQKDWLKNKAAVPIKLDKNFVKPMVFEPPFANPKIKSHFCSLYALHAYHTFQFCH